MFPAALRKKTTYLLLSGYGVAALGAAASVGVLASVTRETEQRALVRAFNDGKEEKVAHEIVAGIGEAYDANLASDPNKKTGDERETAAWRRRKADCALALHQANDASGEFRATCLGLLGQPLGPEIAPHGAWDRTGDFYIGAIGKVDRFYTRASGTVRRVYARASNAIGVPAVYERPVKVRVKLKGDDPTQSRPTPP